MIELTDKVLKRIIKSIENTNEIIEDIIGEYEDEGYCPLEIQEEIQNHLFECTHCGFWVSVNKEINGVCKPCSKELEEDED